jgi:hypothetical protein
MIKLPRHRRGVDNLDIVCYNAFISEYRTNDRDEAEKGS